MPIVKDLRLCFKWLWNNNKEQFIKFMNAQLFNEYSCFDLLYKRIE